MTTERIQADLQYLSARLPHRGANTESERAAADYLLSRLREYTPNAELDEFYSPTNPWLLFASYYGEFSVVALVATWWPWVALVYGLAVSVAYLAEFMGFHLLARFVPQYESQNVVGRFLSARPERLFVVMAHYDSGKASALTRGEGRGARALQLGLVGGMLAVLGSCAVDALNLAPDDGGRYLAVLRWAAAAWLLGGAAAIGYADVTGAYTPGAHDNASGAAALLALAERLAAAPIEMADVYLVATGANQSWMQGARHFLQNHDLDRQMAWILSLDGVGAGAPAYARLEGLLHKLAAPPELVTAAQAAGRPHDVVSCVVHTACSDSLLALTRGYRAMRITSAAGADARDPFDPPEKVSLDAVAQAAAFAEGLLRRVATTSGATR